MRWDFSRCLPPGSRCGAPTIFTRTRAATADKPPLTPSMLNVNEQLERIVEVAIVLLVGAMISTGYWSLPGLMLAAVLFVVIRPLAVWIGVRGADAGQRAAPPAGVVWHSRHRIGVLRGVFRGLRAARCRGHGTALGGVHGDRRFHRRCTGFPPTPLMELYRARRAAGRRPGSPVVGQMMTGATPRSHAVAGACRCAHCARQFHNAPHELGSHLGQLDAVERPHPGTLGEAHPGSARCHRGTSRAAVGPHPGSVRALEG